MSNRNTLFEIRQRQDRIREGVRQHGAVDFFNVLTGPLLFDLVEAHLPAHRERLYPPTVVLSMFINQSLSDDGSCQRAVNGWAAQRAAEGMTPHSVGTGGYCRARQRLPTEIVTALTRETGSLLCTEADTGFCGTRSVASQKASSSACITRPLKLAAYFCDHSGDACNTQQSASTGEVEYW